MDDFQPRGARLEYWFAKLQAGELSFLVDWIVRRDSARAEVRISLWVRGHGRVVRTMTAQWGESAVAIDIAGCALTSTRTTGVVHDVRWDLHCDAGSERLEPTSRAAQLLNNYDLQLAARTRARYTGTVEVGGETFRLEEATGSLVHHWGRRLPQAWLWVSADGVGDDDATVEAAIFRSRLWAAHGPTIRGAYVSVQGGGRTAQIMPGQLSKVAASGDETAFEIFARRMGNVVRLTARAPRAAYNDLGEGIHQTLLGDVTVDGWGSCTGRAGLEVRGDILKTSWSRRR